MMKKRVNRKCHLTGIGRGIVGIRSAWCMGGECDRCG